jgi:AcrR family transcriptional regulator
MRTPAPDKPLRRDAERNRQRILETARAVFAERGLSATLDDIAAEAGVGVGTVYRRFPDKDHLIDALFEQRIGEVVAIAERAAGLDDPWEALVAFLSEAAALQAADRGLKEVLLGRGSERLAEGRARIEPIVKGIVERAQAAGVLRDDFRAHDMPMLQLMLSTIADAAREISPDLWRRYLALVLDGMRTDGSPLEPEPTVDEVFAAMGSWRPPRSVR